ncbi:MAG: helix-turn-helix domain-containing protein [Candidatus Dormibacteraceae bacterium]
MPAVDAGALERDAARRGLSMSGLASAAGISRNTMARIRRGLPVQAHVTRRLEEALERIPEFRRVEIVHPPR